MAVGSLTNVMNLHICAFIIFLNYASTLEKNSNCTTPNGETAKCIPVKDCDIIKQSIIFLEPTAIDFARKSQCGYDVEPLVCCGTQGHETKINPIDVTSALPDPQVVQKPPPDVSTIDQPLLPDRTICGIQNPQDRILGGEITGIDEFPWMALLKYTRGEEDSFRCSGTLINEEFVLTAAQCLFVQGYNLTKVRLGEWDFTTDPDCDDDNSCSSYKDVVIAEKIPHSYYNRKNGNNDIALLRLEKKVQYTDYIKPICLPPGSLPVPLPGTKMKISGWGVTESGDFSKVKLKAQVPVVSNLECLAIYPNSTYVTLNQVCAGGEEGVDACRGDSGGPLMRSYERDDAMQQEQWYQEGIIYRGLGCGGKGVPSLYTRIARYNAWIFHNVERS